jgi:hypothetical protein
VTTPNEISIASMTQLAAVLADERDGAIQSARDCMARNDRDGLDIYSERASAFSLAIGLLWTYTDGLAGQSMKDQPNARKAARQAVSS